MDELIQNLEDSVKIQMLGQIHELEDHVKKLSRENEMLKNRCSALTCGTMCMFCPYECENRSQKYRGEKT